MNSVAEDIKDILVSEGIGTFGANTDWGIFISQEPPGGEGEGPDKCVTIFENGGEPEDSLNGDRVDNFSFQVRCRTEAGGYLSAYNKLEDIITILNQKKDYILVTQQIRYAIINRDGLIEFLYRDSNNRAIFICNFSGLRTNWSLEGG